MPGRKQKYGESIQELRFCLEFFDSTIATGSFPAQARGQFVVVFCNAHPRCSSTVPWESLCVREISTNDEQAVWPVSPPWGPADIAATVCESPGVSPESRIPDEFGRSLLVRDRGTVIDGVF